MSIVTKEWTRPAASGQGEIFSRLWAAPQPKAVLMIAHGMAEHSGRYDPFARYLAEAGWAVCMNDHAGHGRSAITKGYFADENGWDCVVNDLHNLMQEVSAQYPGLPLFIMGHSMGSFLTREYITRWGNPLCGAVICGTMGKNPALGAGLLLAKLQCKLKGPKSPGKLLDKISFGSFAKQFENPVNNFAWLSASRQNCIDYAKDPDCGFLFTAKGFADLYGGIQAITGDQWAQRVPRQLPCFVVAGDKDPVGSSGKGPAQVADWLKAAGVEDVTLHLYPGLRHEILNEEEKYKVFSDLNRWLDAHIPGAEAGL